MVKITKSKAKIPKKYGQNSQKSMVKISKSMIKFPKKYDQNSQKSMVKIPKSMIKIPTKYGQNSKKVWSKFRKSKVVTQYIFEKMSENYKIYIAKILTFCMKIYFFLKKNLDNFCRIPFQCQDNLINSKK